MRQATPRVARIGELTDPRGIAVVGASESRYYARSVIQNLIAAGYDAAKIFPVHPRNDTVLGLPVHASLAQIGAPVSVVVVATGPGTVTQIVQETGAADASCAVVLTDGYAEQGPEGRRRQQSLEQVAREVGVDVLGPNTLGYVASASRAAVWAAGQLTEPVADGALGVVFQSSGMLNLFLSLCIHRHLGIRAAFSVGNEMSLDAADFISFFARDPSTKVIAALMETTSSPRRLAMSLREAEEAGKPVVMLKLGMSERAQRNAVAHTGRMASAGHAWMALLERLGVTTVNDLDELLETVAVFNASVGTGLSDKGTQVGVGFVTVSGGDCSLLADMADSAGLPVGELQVQTRERLADLLEKPDLLGNPLDCENLLRQDAARFYEAVEALCGDPGLGTVAFRMYLPPSPTPETVELYRALIGRARGAGKRPVVLSRAIEPLDRAWYEFFGSMQVPFLPSYRPALTSLAAHARWCDADDFTEHVALQIIPERLEAGQARRIASWDETQRLLARAGVPYAPAILAVEPEEAVAAARRLTFPVAVKLVSSVAAHKSDIGGVRLGLGDEAAVAAAVEAIDAAAAAARIEVQGYEVQSMAPPGFEMLIGMTRDPAIGPLVMIGIGGTLTEVTNDVIVTPPALSEADVHRLLSQLAAAPLLAGYRGAPPPDMDAYAKTVVNLSRYLCESADPLLELDFNPVIVLPEGNGLVVVDALAVLASPSEARSETPSVREERDG